MRYPLNRSQQRGTALLVSMIILLLMSLIILQGARSANLELLIGNNAQHAAEALMRAENSVIAAEKMIETDFSGAPTNNYQQDPNDGIYVEGQIDVNTVDWAALEAKRVGNNGSYREYIVEYLGPASATGGSASVGAGTASDTRYVYRISGRGESGRGGARVIQTIYATAE